MKNFLAKLEKKPQSDAKERQPLLEQPGSSSDIVQQRSMEATSKAFSEFKSRVDKNLRPLIATIDGDSRAEAARFVQKRMQLARGIDQKPYKTKKKEEKFNEYYNSMHSYIMSKKRESEIVEY